MRDWIGKFWNSTLVRFAMVGVVNTLFGTAIMFVLYNVFGVGYWISSACNYIFGSILSFFLNKYFTFRDTARSWSQVLRFAVNIAACYLLAYGIAKPLVYALLEGQGASVSLRDNAAMLVGMGLFVCFNYLGQRFFAFRKSNQEKKEGQP